VCAHLAGREPVSALEARPFPSADTGFLLDLGDVRGQVYAKRALAIAAAGGPSLLTG